MGQRTEAGPPLGGPPPGRGEALAALVSAVTGSGSASDAERALASLGLEPGEVRDLSEKIALGRRELVRLRRREYELGVLFSSARELAAERDGEALLEKIVDRAHQMMGSDLTYLSEYDPATRELFVRTTIGSVSPDFRALRVPPGKGLASLVVERGAAMSVTRYAEFETGRHEAGIDAAVAAEGIVSMLGVPMLADDEVLGVLFVATRAEHAFTPEDTALLTALADHASVVLQTARMLRSLQRAEDESRRALSRLTEHMIQRDRAHAVHRKLVEAVLTGGDFGTVAATLSDELARPVALADRAGGLLARAGSGLERPGALRDEALLGAVRRSAESGRLVPLEDGGPVDGVVAFAAGERHLGTVFLGRGGFALSDVDARTVERAAQVCALLLLSQEAVAETEYRVHGELIADLLSPDPERRRDAMARGRQRGMDAADLTSLLAFSVPAGQRGRAVRLAAKAAPAPSLAGEHQGLVIVLGRPGLRDRAEEIRRGLAHLLEGEVLGVLPAPGEPSAQFPLVKKTVKLLEALRVSDALVETGDYLPYAAVFDADAPAMEDFLHRTLGRVKSYDAERGTELLRTLRAFVHHGASPTRAARALNFHVNTILQRLERLDRVLGSGWRDDEDYFRLTLAVRMDELRERLVGGAEETWRGASAQ
ncbi:helix-turn-helix domain-containing protein [Nocardiopsis changdeensis]|uniref:GAF domain-containing protein n=1 Tax=Nocardiopsis changdeensis TaxID=2831969 RepID=A0ABX8BV25_9ACTN|nr:MULTISPECIES: GAF domain-containing protein [Nocardiopsis]QUX25064.1 GAF domain-containing protein [Nocardiopsis changdeensis]QYX35450.1 GAF domain-containing protein [Nocardiopsis sp. MT53]